jgi:hypothetical protein
MASIAPTLNTPPVLRVGAMLAIALAKKEQTNHEVISFHGF